MFGFLRQSIKGFRLLHMYVVLYLALHLPVPYISYDRYLVPLLPFLLMFLVTELGAAVALARKGVRGQPIQNLGVALIVFLVTSTICIAIYGYSSGIKGSIAMLKTIYANAIDERESVQWINAYTDPSEILVCYRDPTYYLYTHRKTIPLTITKAGNSQQPDPSLLITPISNAGAKYLVTTSIDFEHDYDTELQREALAKLLEEYSKTFVLVFEPTNGHTRIYRINNNAT